MPLIHEKIITVIAKTRIAVKLPIKNSRMVCRFKATDAQNSIRYRPMQIKTAGKPKQYDKNKYGMTQLQA